MMAHHNSPPLRKTTHALIIIFTLLYLLPGCGGGGGGGGGSQPIITPENKIPTASITSPTDTQFKEGENIDFGGTGTDEEDGELDGAALVWTSNIDGTIGTGTAVTTSALTAGDHEITLTATDSQGGEHSTAPTLINIQQTRFIKMGAQTTPALTDASNAFDGDHATAATIMTTDSEFIHFKAYIGGADTFLFKVKYGASTPGSRLAIQALKTDDKTWQPVREVGLNTAGEAKVIVPTAQTYKDAKDYINMRAIWIDGAGEDSASIHELWRIDPIYAGSQTTGATDAELAFDGDPATATVLDTDWDGSAPFLNFKAYVGTHDANTFIFHISHNPIPGPAQSLVIEIETPSPRSWRALGSFNLDGARTETVTVRDVQKYLDADGYISLRAYWVGFGASNQLEIYEIWGTNAFFVGSKTTVGVVNPGLAVDRNNDTDAEITYFWGEDGHFDFLHLQTYVGDQDILDFYINAAQSTTGAELVIDVEIKPNVWWTIRGLSLDAALTNEAIKIQNAHDYTDINGWISMRIKWESGSSSDSGYIQEIWQERK